RRLSAARTVMPRRGGTHEELRRTVHSLGLCEGNRQGSGKRGLGRAVIGSFQVAAQGAGNAIGHRPDGRWTKPDAPGTTDHLELSADLFEPFQRVHGGWESQGQRNEPSQSFGIGFHIRAGLAQAEKDLEGLIGMLITIVNSDEGRAHRSLLAKRDTREHGWARSNPRLRYDLWCSRLVGITMREEDSFARALPVTGDAFGTQLPGAPVDLSHRFYRRLTREVDRAGEGLVHVFLDGGLHEDAFLGTDGVRGRKALWE